MSAGALIGAGQTLRATDGVALRTAAREAETAFTDWMDDTFLPNARIEFRDPKTGKFMVGSVRSLIFGRMAEEHSVVATVDGRLYVLDPIEHVVRVGE